MAPRPAAPRTVERALCAADLTGVAPEPRAERRTRGVRRRVARARRDGEREDGGGAGEEPRGGRRLHDSCVDAPVVDARGPSPGADRESAVRRRATGLAAAGRKSTLASSGAQPRKSV